MSNPMSLEGRRIIVTGASSGIGRACAELAAELGASVILTARRADQLEDVRRSMLDPDRHLCVSCDVVDDTALDLLFSKALAGGRIDGLVHAAGVGPAIPLAMMKGEQLKSVFEVNYFAFVKLIQRVSKFKVRGPRLSIVAISSVAAESGWNGVTAYASSKGALSACVRAGAMELAANGVRVNAVLPSCIKTPMFEATSGAVNDADALRELIKKQPLGLGAPSQVASAVCFLLSDAASFITGVNLPVDGGFLAH